MPGVQALDLADLQGLRPAQSQERPEQAPAGRAHPGKGPGAGAPRQSQQDLFGLVIERMAEQDHSGTGLISGGVEGGVAGLPGRRLRAHAGRGDVDGPHHDGRKTEVREGPGGGGGHLCRAWLELVVHDDGSDAHGVAAHMPAAAEVGGNGGECQ